MCSLGVPEQRVQHHVHRAVLLHRVRVRSPLVVQHHGGVHPGAEAAPDLVVPGQDPVQAQRGALRAPPDDGVAARVHGAADVSRAEGEEGAAVQQQALVVGSVVLQEPLQHGAVHRAQLLHGCRLFVGSCSAVINPPAPLYLRISSFSRRSVLLVLFFCLFFNDWVHCVTAEVTSTGLSQSEDAQLRHALSSSAVHS